jgi:DNA-binding NarL/FixJ family response regulator
VRAMRQAAASASSATPVECSRSHGDLRPAIAAIAANAASILSPAIHCSGVGSLSSACAHIRVSSSSARRSSKFRVVSSASRGSYAAPVRRYDRPCAAERGDRPLAALCELTFANSCLARGRVRTAARWAGEAALHFATADPPGLRTVALGRLAFAQAMVGERQLAASSLEQADRRVRERPQTWIEDFELSRARAWTLAAHGQMAQAQLTAVEAAARMGEVLHRRLILLSDAIRLGFPARTLAERIDRLSARCDSPYLLAICAHASAMATEQAAALEAAAARFESLGAVLHAAESEAEASRAHGRAGDSAAVHRAAARSRALAGDCEGARTPALVLVSSPAAELTRREHEVDMLVAQQLANAQIAQRLVLSVRTVESHVYNVFSKLGVTNRAEIAALITPASHDTAAGGDRII